MQKLRKYTDAMAIPSLSSLIATTYKPKAETIPLIRSALKFYRVCAYVTGVLLLLVTVEAILHWGFNEQVQLGGPFGFLTLVGGNDTQPGINLSVGVLIVHGWFYVVYLLADFTLWSRMRWPFAMFVLVALGGIVPFLSFIAEHFVRRRAERELDELTAASSSSTPATMDAKTSGVEATN
jgi:integral membrane protein